MDEKRQSRPDIIRRSVESMRGLNLLNDTFASVALEDGPACQHVLRILLGLDDLEVIDVKGQYRMLNPTAKDAILDVFAQCDDGRLVNVEIQRKDTLDHARRIRYYGSMIDKGCLDKGAGYDELPDVYVVYVSETDLCGAGTALCRVEKTLEPARRPYEDGRHVVFVNAAVDDGSEAAALMRYFKAADPDDMGQGDLSRRVRYLKREEGGYEHMCEIAEKLISYGREEGIEQGLEQGREQGRRQQARETALYLHGAGLDSASIAEAVRASAGQVEEWIARKPA